MSVGTGGSSGIPMVSTTRTRDHRVDFYRGIALLSIFVNHIPGTLWEDYTPRNFGFSDAAELFVFLAGFAAAFAYGRPFLSGSRFATVVKCARRAGTLYLVHVTLSCVALALFCWAATSRGMTELLRTNAFDVVLSRPLEMLVGIPMLTHQFGYVNILPMYIVILLAVPAMLALARIHLDLMLAASCLLWAAAGLWSIDIPNHPSEGGWFFNPFAWQFLFAIGLWCGIRKWRLGVSVPWSPVLMAAASAYLLVSFVVVRTGEWWLLDAIPLPVPFSANDKTYLTVPRLLHLLSLVYVFANASRRSPLSSIAAGNPLAAIGRHSLPLFATGTMLSLLGQVAKNGREPFFVFDTCYIAVGVLVHLALATWLDWWRACQKGEVPVGGIVLPAFVHPRPLPAAE
jgi:hypothetical protein